jgi:membrane protease YdiL (CAAX protease family)
VPAAALGLAAGIALFGAVARRRPRLPARAARPLPLALARHGFFGVWAANEEVVWRRVVLGELLWLGVVCALAASSGAFALAHRARRGVHVGTGMTFGALYVATGALLASIAAHWAYNSLVAAAFDRERTEGGPAP